ncbi:hypothetical protein BKA82DRAFT_10308 [Pisolithus tinctorius]|uniref:Uncharacterized protein n=1 Tax=Pisolithus tinctorius Marx 270 TaxID=870435 RepID=A0A0C3JQN0_PISTI|nr:hypothetical protein BKA82DRAFT_10308 [Pisolithus tinctorius]KIN99811.1 hypothetical protein M404DRAFT_10308 [Pisolithus tinctorius Marx 270]
MQASSEPSEGLDLPPIACVSTSAMSSAENVTSDEESLQCSLKTPTADNICINPLAALAAATNKAQAVELPPVLNIPQELQSSYTAATEMQSGAPCILELSDAVLPAVTMPEDTPAMLIIYWTYDDEAAELAKTVKWDPKKIGSDSDLH